MRLSQLGAKELNVSEEIDISAIIAPHTTQNQYDAMASLAASIGFDAFRRSSLLKKHNAGCFRCAQGQFMAWCRKPDDREQRQREREVYYYGYE